jgi:hypothetical protein
LGDHEMMVARPSGARAVRLFAINDGSKRMYENLPPNRTDRFYDGPQEGMR